MKQLNFFHLLAEPIGKKPIQDHANSMLVRRISAKTGVSLSLANSIAEMSYLRIS